MHLSRIESDLADEHVLPYALGDALGELGRSIDFESFRSILNAALACSGGAKGRRPPYDPVLSFKVLVLETQYNGIEHRIRDRLS
jgi:IS5 family transposase